MSTQSDINKIGTPLIKNSRIKVCVLLGIFVFVFIWSSFFLQGLQLFDNDYSFWIHLARQETPGETLWHTFDPILEKWNIQFRPFQVLIFKGLFPLFGYSAPGYYYFKSFLLALFSIIYFTFLMRYFRRVSIALGSTFFVALSSSTFTSLYWVSDFVLVSELLALFVYALYLNLEIRDTKPGKALIIGTLALMVVLTLLCDRTKANGKLIPAILLFHLLVVDWKKIKRYGIPIVLMLGMLIPIKEVLKNPVPSFIAETDGVSKAFAWQPASWKKLSMLLFGDFEPLSLIYSNHPPISVCAIIGFPIIYAAILGSVVLFWRWRKNVKIFSRGVTLIRDKIKSPNGTIVTFFLVWALVNMAALASYPTLPEHFQARYAISVLIPLLPLFLRSVYQALRALVPLKKWVAVAVISALVASQAFFHTGHTFRMRNGFPTFIIASDSLRDYVADNFTNSLFIYLNMPVMSYKPTDTGNTFISCKRHCNLTELAAEYNIPVTDCYILTLRPIRNNPQLVLHRSFPGISNALYDRLFNQSEPTYYKDTIYLYGVRQSAESRKE